MEMSFNGGFEVGIPRGETFDLLSDPENFVPILPMYHSMAKKENAPDTAIVKLKIGIGKVHGIATTQMSLQNREAPTSASYVGRGTVMGGAYNILVGFELEDTTSGGTRVSWEGTSAVHGRILSIAGGGLKGMAEKEITKVIDALQDALQSKEHFESVVQAATAAPVSVGFYASLVNFFKGLFGTSQDKILQQTAEDLSVAVPVRIQPLRKDVAIPVSTSLGSSIQVDGDGGDSWVGQPLRRKEDERLVRGLGRFVDDYQASDMLHMGFVTSPYAHARILSIDTSAADALPGVVLTMIGKDVAALTTPFMQIGAEPGALIDDYGIAQDKVFYPGEPVVLIVANSAREVEDGIAAVEVDYEPLPVILESEEALNSDNVLHEKVGSNVIFNGVWDHGDVDQAFADAAHVVDIGRLHFHRFSSTPIETSGTVATWSKQGEITLVSNNGLPGVTVQMLGPYLNVSTEQIRMKSEDVGGNFGTKTVNHTYMGLAAVASRAAGGRTVKWIETRSENLACFHGGERTFLDTQVALDAEGVITGLRSRHIDDAGAYTRYEPLGASIWAQVYPATYKIRNLHIDFSQTVSNKAPCTPNRGYSRMQHIWFMERVLDICGHELNIPADEMRHRNYIRPEQMPYTTPNGNIYDSGDYPMMLDKAKDLIGYDEWQRKQAEARTEGRWIGIGIGSTVDSGSNNFGQVRYVNPDQVFSGNNETARVKVGLDGSVVVTLGSAPQGQGHETTTAQVVADDLNIGPDMVTVRTGFDSAWNTYAGLSGTIASQFVVTGLSAVHGAAMKLKAELLRLASHALQVDESLLELGVGDMGPQVSVIGDPEQAINFWMLSNLANSNTASVSGEFHDITLNVTYVYKPPFEPLDLEKKTGNQTLTYAPQIHIAVVEVDKRTCQPKILDYAVVDDCGVAINPKIVEGQVHGAVCHGLGAAMQEAFQFDEGGNLITATFTDYAPMTSVNMPTLKTESTETPSPFTYNGAKGCGEGGGAPLHCISAAVQDAMHAHGVIVTESHNSPSIIMEALAAKNRDQIVSVSHK
jgi:CO/xanthine dehydrogenase Mo-binding subunit/carbon monoxide dehydrogenase subunit G